MRKQLVLLPIVAALALARPAHAQDDAVLAACDAAAAAPAAEGVPAGVPGVPAWRIERWTAMEACEPAAKLAPDNGRIAFQLGRAYFASGLLGRAFAAFTRADELGYALGSFNLAAMYKNGLGVDADPAKARSLLEKVARGEAVAALLRWLEKAGAGGDADAMNLLASLHRDGWGVPVDHARAVDWFRKAAEAGHVGAMIALAGHYRQGLGVPVDEALAGAWLKKAADADARDRAASIARARAEDPRAITGRALDLLAGSGVQADPAQALSLFEQAASAGDAVAMANLARMYEEGRGAARDHVRAREWAEKAAARGHGGSMLLVGRAHDYGCGVAPDAAEARRWYEKALASIDPRVRDQAGQALALLDRPDLHRVRVSRARTQGCAPSASPQP